MPRPSSRVVRRHDHRERAAAQLVRRAALDEERVADDRGAVAEATRSRRPARRRRSSRRAPRSRSRPPSARSRRSRRRPIPSRSTRWPETKLPIVSPSPLAPRRIPKPMLPASSETFASATSATLIAPTPSVTTFQTMSTVRSARERRTTRKPSPMSRPVAAALDVAHLQPRGRDPREQERRRRRT